MSLINADLELAISALESRIKRLENIRGGRDIIVESAPGGVIISARKAAAARGRREDNSGGTLQEIQFDQGEDDNDTWSRAADDCPVQITVVTDIQYDTTTHKLTLRGRELVYDRGGNLSSISAETDLVEITEAIEHT